MRLGSVLGHPLGLAIADLNADGHPDIAVADGATATVMFQVANQPGVFQELGSRRELTARVAAVVKAGVCPRGWGETPALRL